MALLIPEPNIALVLPQRGPQGATGASGDEVNLYSRQYGESISLAASAKYSRTAGALVVGDGGQALHVRVDAEPSHEGKYRSVDRYLSTGVFDAVDGGWHELAERSVNPLMLGEADDADGWGALNAFAAARQTAGVLVRGAAVSAMLGLISIGIGSGDALARSSLGTTAATAETADIRDVILIGDGLLPGAVDAVSTIGIGGEAFGNATPGPHNIAIGKKALYNVTAGASDAGSRNIAIGGLSLHFLTTGKYDIMVGRNSGHSFTTAGSSTGVGYRCLTGGLNPTGLSGEIITIDAVTNGGQTGIGYEALRYSNGQYNTAGGTSVAENIKAGEHNALWGARSLLDADSLLSVGNFTIDNTLLTGTYSQSGTTTITLSIVGIAGAPYAAPADIIGKRIRVEFTTGSHDEHTIDYIVLASPAPTANSVAVIADVSATASGNASVSQRETAVAGTVSSYNTALGVEAGIGLLTSVRNVLLGYRAGASAQVGVTSLSNALVMANLDTRMPMMSGDFSNGYLGLWCKPSDLTGVPFEMWKKPTSGLTVSSKLMTVSDVSGSALWVLGDATASFPALKRSSIEIRVVLGNDSGYARIAAKQYQLNALSTISGLVDGKIVMTDAAGTAFTSLQFGGTTNQFPEWQRSTTFLQAKLADNSAFTGIVASQIQFGALSIITSTVNGNVSMTNAAGNDFGLLRFGGTTSSFPALKRSAAKLQMRLGDDSDYTAFDASVITAGKGTAITAGGVAGTGLLVSSTAFFGVFFGSGLPTISAAKGSLYLRSDGSNGTNRVFVNTDGSTTWVAINTVS